MLLPLSLLLQRNVCRLNLASVTPPSFQFITDPGVEQCGSLTLNLDSDPAELQHREGDSSPREIQARMLFGDTEIKATALDVRCACVGVTSILFLLKKCCCFFQDSKVRQGNGGLLKREQPKVPDQALTRGWKNPQESFCTCTKVQTTYPHTFNRKKRRVFIHVLHIWELL